MITYRKLVMPSDMNPAGCLFGGQMMMWIDEAAALYAMCQMESKNIRTLKISEIVFQHPVSSGDFLEFEAVTRKVGTSSMTIEIIVKQKDVEGEYYTLPESVCTCSIIFVNIDPITGKSKPHGIT